MEKPEVRPSPIVALAQQQQTLHFSVVKSAFFTHCAKCNDSLHNKRSSTSDKWTFLEPPSLLSFQASILPCTHIYTGSLAHKLLQIAPLIWRGKSPGVLISFTMIN